MRWLVAVLAGLMLAGCASMPAAAMPGLPARRPEPDACDPAARGRSPWPLGPRDSPAADWQQAGARRSVRARWRDRPAAGPGRRPVRNDGWPRHGRDGEEPKQLEEVLGLRCRSSNCATGWSVYQPGRDRAEWRAGWRLVQLAQSAGRSDMTGTVRSARAGCRHARTGDDRRGLRVVAGQWRISP